MSEFTLESLGFDKDELFERVVESIAKKIYIEMEGSVNIRSRIVDRMNAAIDNIAAKNVLPNIESFIENFCLQETNNWGEKVGKSITFTEYLVSRAEAWITEQVDYKGEPKGRNSFAWNPRGTRITFLIHQHLSHQIEIAIKQALSDFNKSLAKGLQETVKLQLQETLNKLKVEVKQ